MYPNNKVASLLAATCPLALAASLPVNKDLQLKNNLTDTLPAACQDSMQASKIMILSANCSLSYPSTTVMCPGVDMSLDGPTTANGHMACLSMTLTACETSIDLNSSNGTVNGDSGSLPGIETPSSIAGCPGKTNVPDTPGNLTAPYLNHTSTYGSASPTSGSIEGNYPAGPAHSALWPFPHMLDNSGTSYAPSIRVCALLAGVSAIIASM